MKKKRRTLNPYAKAERLANARSCILWTTKDGRDLWVTEMAKEHIQNTIVMLLKKQDEFTKYKVGTLEINGMTANDWVVIFRDELKYRNLMNE